MTDQTTTYEQQVRQREIERARWHVHYLNPETGKTLFSSRHVKRLSDWMANSGCVKRMPPTYRFDLIACEADCEPAGGFAFDRIHGCANFSCGHPASKR